MQNKKISHKKNTEATEWRVDYTDAIMEEKDQLKGCCCQDPVKTFHGL